MLLPLALARNEPVPALVITPLSVTPFCRMVLPAPTVIWLPTVPRMLLFRHQRATIQRRQRAVVGDPPLTTQRDRATGHVGADGSIVVKVAARQRRLAGDDAGVPRTVMPLRW